ncbi:MAG: hypothetical protein HYX29_01290 [Solirubrobacterales bacterium]|nr:hypothetical protein [Solirubrobacterales bacterium]
MPLATDCLAIASVLVSAIGLVIALAAAWYAKRAVDIAEDQFNLARDEHDEWKKDRAKHPEIKIEIHPVQDLPDGVMKSDASASGIRLIVGIWNEGNLPAGPTTVNVLAPEWLSLNTMLPFHWCGPNGEEIHGTGAIPTPIHTAEKIKDVDGEEYPVRYLNFTLDRVGTSAHPVLYAAAHFEIPAAGMVRKIPFIARASTDDSPPAEARFDLTLMRWPI